MRQCRCQMLCPHYAKLNGLLCSERRSLRVIPAVVRSRVHQLLLAQYLRSTLTRDVQTFLPQQPPLHEMHPAQLSPAFAALACCERAWVVYGKKAHFGPPTFV